MISFKYDVSTYRKFFFEAHYDTVSYLREYAVIGFLVGSAFFIFGLQ